MNRQWCREILVRKFTQKQIHDKTKTLLKFARKTFPVSGCFTLDWLGEILVKIDHLWYDSLLLPSVIRTYGHFTLYIDDSERHVAGYIKESYDKTSISMHMNRDLFADLFKQKERGYHSGGLLCKDRLVCALHVILHETVHLALTLCDKLGYRKDIHDHGKEFRQIVQNMFGHTDPQHGLIPGYDQTHDLETIKKSIKKNMMVEVFDGNKWSPCQIKHKGKTWIRVLKTDDQQVLSVHVGMIRLKNEE